MASLSAPKSADYDARAAERQRRTRIDALTRKSTFTPAERDEALRLLLEDYRARQDTVARL
jgi:hypothetical protein